MEISGNTAFYAGLSTIQTGQNRADQAASQIANNTIERSVTSQSSEAQVDRLRDEFGVYLIASGRMCVAGLNVNNVHRVAQAFAAVM